MIVTQVFFSHNMKKIYLTGKRGIGKFAIVDDAYYQVLCKYKWNLDRDGYAYNVSRSKENWRNYVYVSMSRLIMDCPKGLEVDHLNRIRLDNRSNNLRICSHKENMKNMRVY